jgi:hypothetical protein
MSQPWVGQNYSGSECHSVTKRPLFGVDGQSVHFETECHSRKLSQSRNVTVEKCHMVEVSQLKIVTDSECHSSKMSHGRSVAVENCHRVGMSQ